MSSTPKQVNASYHPGGYGTSPSLQRARKPYLMKNALVGGVIFSFAMGVYVYSISAVKQDDFADVADLLPPAEERSKIRTIEDEARDKKSMTALQSIASAIPKSSSLPSSLSSPSSSNTPIEFTSSPSAVSPPLPSISEAVGKAETGLRRWLPRRLSDLDWVKGRGLVEDKGNVVVWGAPDVDRVGRVQDGGVVGGKRVV